MDYTQIILKPIETEKTAFIRDGFNQVTFLVNPRANKIEVKKAVEEAFDVKVEDVKIVVRKSAPKTRQGRVVGKVSGWKKAYVTLAEGDKIPFYEGV